MIMTRMKVKTTNKQQTQAVWQWRRWQDVGVSETATETPDEQTIFFFNLEKVKVIFHNQFEFIQLCAGGW